MREASTVLGPAYGRVRRTWLWRGGGGYGREETRLKSESMGDIMWNGRKKVKGRISEA